MASTKIKLGPSWALILLGMLLFPTCNVGTATVSAAAFIPTTPWTALMDGNQRKDEKNSYVATESIETRATAMEATEAPSLVESATVFSLPCSKSNAWRALVPPLNLFGSEGRAGPDVTVEWSVDDNIHGVAEAMIGKLGLVFRSDSDVLVNYLTRCMEQFQSFCLEHLSVGQEASIKGFRARIDATRGSKATRCPRWHVDHVPVRWIQSLVGPGCVCLEQDALTGHHGKAEPELR